MIPGLGVPVPDPLLQVTFDRRVLLLSQRHASPQAHRSSDVKFQ